MIWRVLAGMVAAVLLGCVNPMPPEETITTGVPELAHPSAFKRDSEFFAYADDLNWHLMYLFSYTQSINQYAKLKGWKPPQLMPLCRLVDWPKMQPMPVFAPIRVQDTDIEGYERELTHYVKELRKQYLAEQDHFEIAEQQQRLLCLY